jgi:NAD(P)-dependent dehydrogenase (short-subunit alcohol dehydrogenase family)
MTTIAIVGVGRGLGTAAACRFGREGFDIALLSRSR